MSMSAKNILKVAVIAVGAIVVAKRLPVVQDYV
jgi:hypothetical protein